MLDPPVESLHQKGFMVVVLDLPCKYKYEMVSGHHFKLDDFTRKLSGKASVGWEPCGVIHVVKGGNNLKYFNQLMKKELT